MNAQHGKMNDAVEVTVRLPRSLWEQLHALAGPFVPDLLRRLALERLAQLAAQDRDDGRV